MLECKAKILVVDDGLLTITLDFFNLVLNDEKIVSEIISSVLEDPEIPGYVNAIVREMSGDRLPADYIYVILESKYYMKKEELILITNSVIKRINSFNNSKLLEDAHEIARNLVIERENIRVVNGL